MTEDEAKAKTCVQTLAPVASADGSAPWHSPASCIGSQCMMWRWELTEHGIREMRAGRFDPAKGDATTGGPSHGWCSLGSKP